MLQHLIEWVNVSCISLDDSEVIWFFVLINTGMYWLMSCLKGKSTNFAHLSGFTLAGLGMY